MSTTMQTPRVRICTSPQAAELLPAYIVDDLDDAQAETVENHLNECDRCKEHYLTVLEARSEAPERLARLAKATNTGPSAGEPVETLTPSVRRKGKAGGSLV